MAKGRDSSDEDESFVTIGTPLPLYDEDEAVVRKPVGVQEQVVRDTEGRVRFHGAFTGGFSAGYFNTVGSKEGWIPKTFISSRSQRAGTSSSQKPEDFMDEEDFSEFGIAPKVISTKDNFASKENEQKSKEALSRHLAEEGAIPGAESLFVDLVLPKRSSIGVRLLRKLGWKEGQGVGPRTKRKRKAGKAIGKASDQKVYGCALPPGYGSAGSGETSDDDFSEAVTFAPKDVCPISFEPKNNLHGIDYHGLNPKVALGHFSLAEPKPLGTTGRRGIRGQAFGVGALEDDDEDIYSVESMANYDRVLSDEPVGHSKKNFGWSAPRDSTGNTSLKAIGHAANILPGFKPAGEPLPPRTIYPPPQLPKDFQPFHRFEAETEKVSVNREKQRKMDVHSRGALLGETPHLNSVFELVSSEDKARMEVAKMSADVTKQQLNKTDILPTSSGTSQPENQTTEPSSIVQKDDSIKSASVSQLEQPTWTPMGFTPFAKNPAKQKRYEQFLEAVKLGNSYAPSDGIHTTEWEREREREEFAQAARLYKPLPAMIASRFTRAKYDDDDVVSEQLAKDEGSESDESKAASMKMFGKLTRQVLEWHPDKSLCKRFNIPNPYPDSAVVGLTAVKRDKFSVFNFLNFPSHEESSSSKPADQRRPVDIPESTTSKVTEVPVPLHVKPLAILATVDLRPKTLASSAADSSEPPANVETTQKDSSVPLTVASSDTEGVERPPLDLFKAIFENSESSSSSSSSESDVEEGDDVKLSVSTSQLGTAVTSAPANSTEMLSSHISQPVQSDSLTKTTATSAGLAAVSEFTPLSEPVTPSYDALADKPTTSSVDLTATATTAVSAVDYFGPLLPPCSGNLSASTATAAGVIVKVHRHSSRHHHRDQHSHKKSKHKKKSKKKEKRKKKKKKKKKIEIAVTSSSSSDADAEDEGSDADSESGGLSLLDKKLLSRLRSLPPDKRSVDFT